MNSLPMFVNSLKEATDILNHESTRKRHVTRLDGTPVLYIYGPDDVLIKRALAWMKVKPIGGFLGLPPLPETDGTQPVVVGGQADIDVLDGQNVVIPPAEKAQSVFAGGLRRGLRQIDKLPGKA